MEKRDEIGLFRASAYKSGNHDSRSSGGGKFLAKTENVKYVLVLAEAKWSSSMQTIFFEELRGSQKVKERDRERREIKLELSSSSQCFFLEMFPRDPTSEHYIAWLSCTSCALAAFSSKSYSLSASLAFPSLFVFWPTLLYFAALLGDPAQPAASKTLSIPSTTPLDELHDMSV